MSGRTGGAPDPRRDPRPQEDGTYLCYLEGCDGEADLPVPRRIESEGFNPVETLVTFCGTHWLAWEVLGDTGQSLSSVVEVHESVSEEFDTEGWVDIRAKARALCNLVLFDDPLGSDPPDDDSPLGDDWEHAGKAGERLREKFETPVEEQVWASEYPDTPDKPPGHDSSELSEFAGGDDDGE